MQETADLIPTIMNKIMLSVLLMTTILGCDQVKQSGEISASYGQIWCSGTCSSGDLIDWRHLNSIFEFHSGYNFGQVVEAA